MAAMALQDRLDKRVVATSLLSAVLVGCGVRIFQHTQFLKKQLAEAREREKNLEATVAEEQRLRRAEREGRTRAQRKLNKQVDIGQYLGPGMTPIGFLDSTYRRRFGTPRQGCVVPRGRAMLRLDTSVQPKFSTQNLEEYSHVWLIYIFHENTNGNRLFAENPNISQTKAKVKPPRLGGASVGLFSTRTPHRPNPIGLSLVKLDRVEDGVLYLSGIDVCNGSPILDVKPYLPYSDSVVDARVAKWVETPVVQPISTVSVSDEALEQAKALLPELQFYHELEEFLDAVKEILANDIRSAHMRNSKLWRHEVGRFRFDNTSVCFRVYDDQDKTCQIVGFEYTVDTREATQTGEGDNEARDEEPGAGTIA